MFYKQRTVLNNIVKASFIVSSKLATSLTPFAQGKCIKECMLEVCSVVCPEKKNEFTKNRLSRRTIFRRIEIKTTLTDRMDHFPQHLIRAPICQTQLKRLYLFDVLIKNSLLLTCFTAAKRTTSGEDIFNKVQKTFISFALPWSKLFGVCTDAALFLVSLQKGN